MTSDNQLEYDALTMGVGTDYPIKTVEGLDIPDLRIDLAGKAGAHGSFFYGQYFAERTIILQGYFNGDNVHEKIDVLRRTFIPKQYSRYLGYKLPDEESRIVYCEPSRAYWPLAAGYGMGQVEWTIELTASDPRLYSATLETYTFVGLLGSIENEGSFPTRPTVRVTGATSSSTLVLTNETTGESLTVNLDDPLTSGQELVLDYQDHTVYLDDDPRYDLLDPSSVWWDIEPGENDLSHSGGGSVEISWRSAWM